MFGGVVFGVDIWTCSMSAIVVSQYLSALAAARLTVRPALQRTIFPPFQTTRMAAHIAERLRIPQTTATRPERLFPYPVRRVSSSFIAISMARHSVKGETKYCRHHKDEQVSAIQIT